MMTMMNLLMGPVHPPPLKNWGALHRFCPGVPRNPTAQLSPSSQQFVSEDSKRPKVGGEVVTFVQQHLWSHVLRCTTECPRLVPEADVFGKSKINLQIYSSAAYKINVPW